MVAFDTNHLVRHILQDNPHQCEVVKSVLQDEALGDRIVRIFDLVLLETSWVLHSVYAFDRHAWSEILKDLLADSIFSFDNPAQVRSALKHYRQGKADFADYLILERAKSEGLELKTFDKRLLKEFRKQTS